MANDEIPTALVAQVSNILYNLGQGAEFSVRDRKVCSDLAKQLDDRVRAARVMEERGLRLVLMPKLNEEYTTESGNRTVNVTQLLFEADFPDGYVYYEPDKGSEMLELFLAKFTKKVTDKG